MKNKILAFFLFTTLNTSPSIYCSKTPDKQETSSAETPSRVENFFSADISEKELEKRLKKEKDKKPKLTEKQKQSLKAEGEQRELDEKELNLRWQLQKQDTSSIQKFVDTLSGKKKTAENTELARYQRRIKSFEEFTKQNEMVTISREQFKEQVTKMSDEDKKIIASIFNIREQDLINYLGKKVSENDTDFSFKMQKAIEDYEKLVRDEAYGKIFGRQKRVESILKGLLAIGAFAAFTGIMISMVIVPAAQQVAEQKEKLKKLKELDLGALQKNKEMLTQLKTGNIQALGAGAGGMHPFAQKVDIQKLFGRNLQQSEIESLSALSFRKDAIAKEEGDLTQNPGNMSPEDITTKLAELKMSKGLVDQQIALQEFDTRYSPHVNDDHPPQEALAQRKELIAKLEEKIPNLEELMQKKKIEMATGQQAGEGDQEQLEMLDGTINNLGAEIDYLKKRLVAEQELVSVNIQPDESITDWQKRIDEKEEAVLSTMREKIMEEGIIMRDEREPYETSKLRTTQLLLKLKSLKQQREKDDLTPEQGNTVEEQTVEQDTQVATYTESGSEENTLELT